MSSRNTDTQTGETLTHPQPHTRGPIEGPTDKALFANSIWEKVALNNDRASWADSPLHSLGPSVLKYVMRASCASYTVSCVVGSVVY